MFGSNEVQNSRLTQRKNGNRSNGSVKVRRPQYNDAILSGFTNLIESCSEAGRWFGEQTRDFLTTLCAPVPLVQASSRFPTLARVLDEINKLKPPYKRLCSSPGTFQSDSCQLNPTTCSATRSQGCLALSSKRQNSK